ncbi:MAG: hypothetical protein HY862_07285 [Chloroflexi bacterium]|nr:hypothetical protein [Chloroflexota bacterium]
MTDKDCSLPCWWGFTLHRDTLQTTKSTLKNLFPDLLVQSNTGEKSTKTFMVLPTGPDLDSENGNGVVSFWTRNSDNRLVAVNLSLDYPADSYVDWSSYMPTNILTVYGEPEDVTISYPLDGLPRGTSYYLIMSYPQKGIFVSYMMYYATLEEIIDDSVGIPICNYLLDVSLFKMWIQTEDANADDIGISLDALDSLQPNEYHLEDISTYDMASFTEAFSEPDTCIYTLPYDEWVRAE